MSRCDERLKARIEETCLTYRVGRGTGGKKDFYFCFLKNAHAPWPDLDNCGSVCSMPSNDTTVYGRSVQTMAARISTSRTPGSMSEGFGVAGWKCLG
jgi:hypothetical protein